MTYNTKSTTCAFYYNYEEACTITHKSQASLYPSNISQDVVRVDITSDAQTIIKRTSNNIK